MAELLRISTRTIDYYTKLGLIAPAKRTDSNYRLYGVETLQRIERIEWLKQQKLTLEEIKEHLAEWGKVTTDEGMTQRLSKLQLQMEQLEREAMEIVPILDQLKPKQARNLLKSLSPQTITCIEALLLLLGKGPLM